MDYRKFCRKRFFGHLIATPFLWAPLPMLIVLDILSELYHRVCFPIYGITKVRRSEYIQIIDRNKLQYLNFFEKIGCMYCGYANGLSAYLKEIAGRTEKYWCDIMHETKPGFKVQAHQIEQKFSPFGDKDDCEKKYGK